MYKYEYRRRSIRLGGYDYSEVGDYFITLCTAEKQPIFGRIAKHRVRLSEWGRIVKDEWLKTRTIRENFELGKYIIMPDHFHAIVKIVRQTSDAARLVGAAGRPPDEKPPGQRYDEGARRAPLHQYFRPRSLSSFVAGFKAAVTKRINALRGTSGEPIWQRNYYEHIIRSDWELARLEDYIRYNPVMAHK